MMTLLTSTGIVTQRQGYMCEEVHLIHVGGSDHKVKVHVGIDTSYSFQSSVNVDRWDGTQWQRLITRPGQHPTVDDMPRPEQLRQAAVSKLIGSLVREAMIILG